MNLNKRKYQQHIQKLFSKNLIGFPFFLIISIILYSFVVVKNNTPANKFSKPDGKDSLLNNQPKIDIKVNKKYDEKGNLVQYDSSYSIVYSSPNANTNIQFFNFDNDSLFNQFKGNMNGNPLFNDDFFKDFQSFGFDQNFFQMNPMNNIKQLEELMNKMRGLHQTDSVAINAPQNIQPQIQPQAQPKPQNTTPNMITL
ncbi:MAG: hypothetical protein NTZ33_10040 [Bacteroidetes bacterium]|nr:hypothetical protein [Bacteroidota bacterium]